MNIFDIIGPVMIGPSSSHTAGALRIGKIAGIILGELMVEVEISLYGSFAATFRGHGTDRAVLAGLLGFDTDDVRIKSAFQIADKSGLLYSFVVMEEKGNHPNFVNIKAKGKSGRIISLSGASVGGGNIIISEINGIPVNFTGELHTLLVVHRDIPGVVASVTRVLSIQGINIACMKLYRSCRGGNAIMVLETDQLMSSATLKGIFRRQGVKDAVLIKAIAG